MISYARLTKAEYDALETKVANRIYFISDTGEQFLDGLPYDGEDNRDYLCLTALQAGSTFAWYANGHTSIPTVTVEYSLDKRTWANYGWGTTFTLANVGDKVWFRGKNQIFSTPISDTYGRNYNFSMTGEFSASGNVNTLMDWDGNAVLTDSCFYRLFFRCRSLTSIEGLKLPSTNLAANCYNSMFRETGLSDASMLELPATVPASGCYESMFRSCSSLAKAPRIRLSSTFEEGFQSNALRTAFRSCSSLASVEVNFESWPAEGIPNWFQNHSATGVFKCPSALDTSIRDDSHVPAGWTVTYTDVEAGKTIPSATSSDAGKVLTVGTTGTPAWDNKVDEDTLDALDELEGVISSFAEGEEDPLDYFHFTALETLYVTNFYILSAEYRSINYEYSLDKRNWKTFSGGDGSIQATLGAGDKIWFRGDNYANMQVFGYPVYGVPNFTFSGRHSVGGKVASLWSKTISEVTLTNFSFKRWFSGDETLVAVENGFELPSFTNSADGSEAFDKCTSLASLSEGFTIPSNLSVSAFFRNCTSLVLPDGFTGNQNPPSDCFGGCTFTSFGNRVTFSGDGDLNIRQDYITSIGDDFTLTNSSLTSTDPYTIFPNLTSLGTNCNINGVITNPA